MLMYCRELAPVTVCVCVFLQFQQPRTWLALCWMPSLSPTERTSLLLQRLTHKERKPFSTFGETCHTSRKEVDMCSVSVCLSVCLCVCLSLCLPVEWSAVPHRIYESMCEEDSFLPKVGLLEPTGQCMPAMPNCTQLDA